MACDFNALINTHFKWLYTTEKCVWLNFSTLISDSLNHVLACCWFLFVNFFFEIAPQTKIWRSKIWWSGGPIYRTSFTDPATIEITIKYFTCHHRIVCRTTIMLKPLVPSSKLKFSSNIGSSFSKKFRYIWPFKLPSIMWGPMSLLPIIPHHTLTVQARWCSTWRSQCEFVTLQ